MNLPTETFGNVVVVHTPDELGSDQAEAFVEFVAALDRKQVVFDLDDTELLDSAGLAALLNIQEKLRQQDGDVRVIASNGVNRKILEITRLDHSLEVFSSVVEAVKSFA